MSNHASIYGCQLSKKNYILNLYLLIAGDVVPKSH